MFLRYTCRCSIKTLLMEYISNNIFSYSSQPFEKFVLSKKVQKYSRKMREIFAYSALYVIPPLYFNFSDFKTRGNIYIYIFFSPHIPSELSFYTRELILCHITSRSTCNKRQRVVMAQYLTGQSERRVIFLRGENIRQKF